MVLGIFVYLLLAKKDRYGISAFGLEEMNSMFTFQKNLNIFSLISSSWPQSSLTLAVFGGCRNVLKLPCFSSMRRSKQLNIMNVIKKMQQKPLLQNDSETWQKREKSKILKNQQLLFQDLLTNLFLASMPFTSNLSLLRLKYLPHHFSAYYFQQFMLFWQLSWKWNNNGIIIFTKIILHAKSLVSKACKHVLIKSIQTELLNQFLVT